ncbi:MAG TPA: DUF58 domain-containing protein [Solirubrobacteraceae bacterium]|nr:DUF58 domain-containing protein [Solirubrobacteraceae bacterium]
MSALLSLAPTVRAAVMLAVIALLALVVPSWLPIALALVLLGALLADGWMVRRAPTIQRSARSVLSRGASVPLRVTAHTADGRRVLLRQAPAAGIGVDGGTGISELDGAMTGVRRGRHLLPGVASASLGPLGLARVHHGAGETSELRVYPDVVGARRLILRLRRSMAGQPSGMARGPLGLGTEFEAIRDYSVDDDIRAINWRATARLGRPMSNQYRVDRDREVVCLIDCGRLMGASLGSGTVLDAALDAVTVIGLAVDELGDRFGAIAFDDDVRRTLTPRHLGGSDVVERLFDLESRPVDSDFERAFARIGRSRRALVFVHTDLVDEFAARSLLAGVAALVRRHAVIVATASDPELVAVAAANGDPGMRLVALDVLAARHEATVRLRHAGAQVLEAPASRLPERCLQAYVTAKRRVLL